MVHGDVVAHLLCTFAVFGFSFHFHTHRLVVHICVTHMYAYMQLKICASKRRHTHTLSTSEIDRHCQTDRPTDTAYRLLHSLFDLLAYLFTHLQANERARDYSMRLC